MSASKYPVKYWLIAIMVGLVYGCGGSSDAKKDEFTDTGTTLVSSKISDSNLAIGDRFEIEISVENLPRSEGGGISLSFDPAVIAIDSVDIAPAWEFANRPGSIVNGSGRVTDILFTSFRGHSGAVAIATLEARAVGAGSSRIVIEQSPVNPFSASGSILPVQFQATTIQID